MLEPLNTLCCCIPRCQSIPWCHTYLGTTAYFNTLVQLHTVARMHTLMPLHTLVSLHTLALSLAAVGARLCSWEKTRSWTVSTWWNLFFCDPVWMTPSTFSVKWRSLWTRTGSPVDLGDIANCNQN